MKYSVQTLRLTHKNLFIGGIGNVASNVLPTPSSGPLDMETAVEGVLIRIKGKSVLIPWGQIMLCEGVAPVLDAVKAPLKAVNGVK
jgi:hypothetical protein